MKKFLVLSFCDHAKAGNFRYGFVNADNVNDVHEVINEEKIGYTGNSVTNYLIEINQENIGKLKGIMARIRFE